MKQFSLVIASIISSTMCIAQNNNPYSQRGKDYVASVSLIKADYTAGKVKEMSNSTIAYYSGKIPLKNSISAETAATVFNTIQSGKATISSIVNKSSVSETVKKITKEIVFNPNNLTDNQFKDFLVTKNDEINSSILKPEEKEMLLTLSAIAYSVRNEPAGPQLKNNNNQSNGCLVVTEEGTGTMTNSGCIVAGAAIGFYIGFQVCGLWCGIGGGIVGGVVTAITLS